MQPVCIVVVPDAACVGSGDGGAPPLLTPPVSRRVQYARPEGSLLIRPGEALVGHCPRALSPPFPRGNQQLPGRGSALHLMVASAVDSVVDYVVCESFTGPAGTTTVP